MLNKALVVGMIAALPLIASAASVHIGDYFLKGSENAPDDVYALGDMAVFAGSLEGDGVAVSRTIVSQSAVSGDLLLVGENVRVEGSVKDDVRVIGKSITINGAISDDVVAIGSEVEIGPTALIEGSLYVIGDDVKIEGVVRGGVKVLSNELKLTGEIHGDLEAWGKATFAGSAKVWGDFIHHARGKAAQPTNVTIGGAFIAAETGSSRDSRGVLFDGLFSLKLLMMLALGFALFFVARERVEEVLLDALPNFWIRALRGIIVIILAPLLIVLLIFSVVGIPLALLCAALFLALLLLSLVHSSFLFGAWIEQFVFKRSAFPLSYRPVLLGTLGVSLVTLIPFVGPVAYGILFLAAAGSLATVFFRAVRAKM